MTYDYGSSLESVLGRDQRREGISIAHKRLEGTKRRVAHAALPVINRPRLVLVQP
jgi:hypothetical protein